MENRYERQARNEALAREVNERLAELDEQAVSTWAAPSEQLFEFLCECSAEGGCETRLQLTLEEYDRVRAQDDRFAIAPAHETRDIEHVVERHERFVIVDKVDAAEPFTRDDPRGAPSD
jgi:hypothetical protein